MDTTSSQHSDESTRTGGQSKDGPLSVIEKKIDALLIMKQIIDGWWKQPSSDFASGTPTDGAQQRARHTALNIEC